MPPEIIRAAEITAPIRKEYAMHLRIVPGPSTLPITQKSLMSPAPSILNRNSQPSTRKGVHAPKLQAMNPPVPLSISCTVRLITRQNKSHALSTFARTSCGNGRKNHIKKHRWISPFFPVSFLLNYRRVLFGISGS